MKVEPEDRRVATRRRVVMILFAAGGLFLIAGVTLLLWRALAQHRTAERIRIELPVGINSIEKVRLGGLDQWIQIRGHDQA